MKFGEPIFAAADDGFGQVRFLGEQAVDALFDGADGDEFVDLYFALLADAVGAVGGLVFDGGVPPAVEMEHVAGGGQIEAEPAGSQREDENRRLAGGLESVDHFIATASAACRRAGNRSASEIAA